MGHHLVVSQELRFLGLDLDPMTGNGFYILHRKKNGDAWEMVYDVYGCFTHMAMDQYLFSYHF